MLFAFQPMLTPSSIEEFLPATVDVCRDFVQMVGDKVEKGEGRLDSDFLEELKKYFLEVGACPETILTHCHWAEACLVHTVLSGYSDTQS